MIADHRGKKLIEFCYYSNDKTCRMLQSLHRASEDGRLRLVWGAFVPYLQITPEVVWLNSLPQQIQVTSNVAWTNK